MQQPRDVESFDIEFSLDGGSFLPVAHIEGSVAADYSYHFPMDKSRYGFYRVKANLRTGQKVLSEIRYLGGNEQYAINIYPNPVTGGRFIISCTDDKLKAAALFNRKGEIIKRLSFTGRQAEVNVTGFSGGSYILKIISADQKVVSVPVIIL